MGNIYTIYVYYTSDLLLKKKKRCDWLCDWENININTTKCIRTIYSVSVNCVCVMLMSKQYDHLYDKLCCGVICCIRLWENQIEVKQIESSVAAQDKSSK